MIKLSLSPHIGLPDKANIQRFDVFWSTKRNTVHPITLLTQLLETEQEMAQLNLLLKISAPHGLKHWQRTQIMSKNKSHFVREWSYSRFIVKATTN